MFYSTCISYMVVSVIEPSINYPELKKVDKDDINAETSLYEMVIKGVPIVVAIGKQKNTFVDRNIIYFPLYLLKSNNKAMQIGLYEISATNLPAHLDDELNLNLETIDSPLIFSFVTANMLENIRRVPEHDFTADAKKEIAEQQGGGSSKGKNATEELERPIPDIVIPQIRKDIFEAHPRSGIPDDLPEENESLARSLRAQYRKSPLDNWMQRFMSNGEYSLIDNEGGGDCLFITLREAFKTIGQETQVSKLRRRIASEINESMFLAYKEKYEMFAQAIKNIKASSIEIVKQYNLYKEELKNPTLTEEQKRIVFMSALRLKKQNDELSSELKDMKMLLREVEFMKDVHTLEDMRKHVSTCSFMADEWAIRTLERVLNIKIIVFSSDTYKQEDLSNVLHCGGTMDSVLQSRGEFLPEFYIMVDYTGNHYKLIGYKHKYIFKYKELPYDVRKMIIDKCFERRSGLYALIPDFQRMEEKIRGKTAKDMDRHYAEMGLVGGGGGGENGEGSYNDGSIEIDATALNLYDDSIVFSFYNKSGDKALPGHGPGEKIPAEQSIFFSGLSKIEHWRRKLDNMWTQPFTLDNHRWSSVEHYYQANKFKKGGLDFYLSFALESGTDLSHDPLMAKAVGGKSGKYNGEQVRPKNVVIDPDFYDHKEKVLYDALLAKFTQNKDLCDMLLLTRDAKLIHQIKGKNNEICNLLMKIRQEIRDERKKVKEVRELEM